MSDRTKVQKKIVNQQLDIIANQFEYLKVRYELISYMLLMLHGFCSIFSLTVFAVYLNNPNHLQYTALVLGSLSTLLTFVLACLPFNVYAYACRKSANTIKSMIIGGYSITEQIASVFLYTPTPFFENPFVHFRKQVEIVVSDIVKESTRKKLRSRSSLGK